MRVLNRTSQADRVLAGIRDEDLDHLIRAQAAAQRRPGGEVRQSYMDYVDYLARNFDSAADRVEGERHPNVNQLRISRSAAGSLVVMLAADLVAMYFTYKSHLPYFHSNFNGIKLIEDGGLLSGGYCLGASGLETWRRRRVDRVHTRRLRAIAVERAESTDELDRILRAPELSVELRQSGHFIGDDLELRKATTAFCDKNERALNSRFSPVRKALGSRPKVSDTAPQESDLWRRDRWDDGAVQMVAAARLGRLGNDSVQTVARGAAKDLNRVPGTPLARGQLSR